MLEIVNFTTKQKRSYSQCRALTLLMLFPVWLPTCLQAEDLPERPSTNILDNAKMLDASKESEISRKLFTFRETSGIDFLLVTERVSPRRNATEYAKALIEKWNTHDERMIGIYENLTNTFTVHNSETSLDRIGQNTTKSLVLGALHSAGTTTRDSLVPIERIEASVDNLIHNFNRYPVTAPKGRFDANTKLIIGVFAIGCLIALVAFLLVRWLEKIDPKAADARETFKDEKTAPEQGAPFTISKTQRRQIRDLMGEGKRRDPQVESADSTTGETKIERRNL